MSMLPIRVRDERRVVSAPNSPTKSPVFSVDLSSREDVDEEDVEDEDAVDGNSPGGVVTLGPGASPEARVSEGSEAQSGSFAPGSGRCTGRPTRKIPWRVASTGNHAGSSVLRWRDAWSARA